MKKEEKRLKRQEILSKVIDISCFLKEYTPNLLYVYMRLTFNLNSLMSLNLLINVL